VEPDRFGSRASRSIGRRAREQRGAIAVEFAIIVPILMLLVLGILEFGFGYHAWDVTQNAAREGARLAAVDDDVTAIQARVEESMFLLDASNWTITIECKPVGGSFGACGSSWADGDIVRVIVDYSYDFITPLPNLVGLGAQMDMTSVAEARFEGL
jgi:hypothetical protein